MPNRDRPEVVEPKYSILAMLHVDRARSGLLAYSQETVRRLEGEAQRLLPAVKVLP